MELVSRARSILTATLLFNSLTAIGGGLSLATGMLPVPQYLLRNTSVGNYFLPGLFFGIVVGGSAAVAAATSLAQTRRSLHLSGAAGVILIGSIVAETAIIGAFGWLQGVYLLAGVLVVVLAWHPAVGHAPVPQRLDSVAATQ
ncbi:hypothetical protein [Pengzhenrongella phosphoraccumulans]|uniref:hypothetical protein n=1 Tax=Pengzhenrongella phosphoraccumulans TaxID=3114394 RepID=UPI00388F341F